MIELGRRLGNFDGSASKQIRANLPNGLSLPPRLRIPIGLIAIGVMQLDEPGHQDDGGADHGENAAPERDAAAAASYFHP